MMDFHLLFVYPWGMNRSEFLEHVWKPYPEAPTKSLWSGQISSITDSEVSIGGRSHDLRSIFKLGPCKNSGWINFDSKVLRIGDWISCTEEGILLLAPALVLPLKLGADVDVLKKWNQLRKKIHHFFEQRDFLHVLTPNFVASPGTEPFISPFFTQVEFGTQKQKVYLPTSPELSLKKIMSCGVERVYEIKTCFRNGEITPTHQPEFTMLEWYRCFANLDDIKLDLVQLFEFLFESKFNFKTWTMADAFKNILGVQITPQTSGEELKGWIGKAGLFVPDYAEWDDLFQYLFIHCIEPKLPTEEPLFLEKYPPSQAAYSRLTKEGWGDRFELYWRGMELANAFHELNDPKIQRLRMEEDNQKKIRAGKEPVPVDADFIQALESGLPPSAGIALGVDRLFMLYAGLSDISQTRVFAFKTY